jgi:hypothetical protein
MPHTLVAIDERVALAGMRHLTNGLNYSQRRSFANGFAACAFYIKRQAEGLRARSREAG